MKRITSILSGLSLAVLFFVGSAHAQYDAQRMTANIPFEFTVGNISLPAGQYDFLRTGFNVFEIRNSEGHGLYVMASAAVAKNDNRDTSVLKFTTAQGRHVLTQIWNHDAAMGNEFQINESYLELTKQTAIHAISAGRR